MRVFECLCTCDFPRDPEAKDEVTKLGHNLTAFVHPELDGKDLRAPLTEGQNLNLNLDFSDFN